MVAIEVRGLGKRYRLGEQRAAYRTLRESLTTRRDRSVGTRTEFWALRDVHLDVDPGQVVGIVGKNGAGKSTLLKLLARVTLPTTGRAVMHGRVGSLLEVGTGFHPELTGRENIWLNGAILGMSRAEIASRFDAIVEFSEIAEFIDTPVKRYSSGMYVRLAFAVAAHLEPEIMIVDEVLAVGDVAFQRKCLGRMHEVAKGGRTVLFVSHNLGAVNQLCTRAVWLDAGRIRRDGPTHEITAAYLRESGRELGSVSADLPPRDGAVLQLVSAGLTRTSGAPTATFTCDEEVLLRLTLLVHERVPGAYGLVQLRSPTGEPILVSDSRDVGRNPLDALHPGRHTFSLVIPARTLGVGDYEVHVSFASTSAISGFVLDDPGVVIAFRLEDDRTIRGNARGGHLSTLLAWNQDA